MAIKISCRSSRRVLLLLATDSSPNSSVHGIRSSAYNRFKFLLPCLAQNIALVGHTLDCDLRVLKLRHPFLIDLAFLYYGHMGPRRKIALKKLSKTWLQRDIQNHGPQGHDSREKPK